MKAFIDYKYFKYKYLEFLISIFYHENSVVGTLALGDEILDLCIPEKSLRLRFLTK